MNKFRIVLTTLLMVCSAAAHAQWSIGMRDTRYVNVGYTFRQNWNVKLEHSLYSDKFDVQYVRACLSYSRGWNMLEFSGEPYFGMTYRNSYRNLGFNADGKANILKWLYLTAGVTPHWDSGLGYSTLYNVAAGFRCTSQIAIIGGFTNRPEYRMPEKRLRGAVQFTVSNLTVSPGISIPAGSGEGRNIRVLVSMNYVFK